MRQGLESSSIKSGGSMSKKDQYHVALSFAGEDRAYVEKVASILRSKGIRVFYDRYEEASLWGKDLYSHLSDIYQNQAQFTIVFISQHYARKLWTSHERSSAQARAFQDSNEYILPARFDETVVPGILPTTGYIDLQQKTPQQLAELVIGKLALHGFLVSPPVRHKIYNYGDEEFDTKTWTVITISSETDRRRILVNPSAYLIIQDLLDDVFTDYLLEQVNPLTYGSEWILMIDSPAQIIAPWEWITNMDKSIRQLNKAWQKQTSPQSLGINPGQHLSIYIKDRKERQLGKIKNNLRAVGCNDRRALVYLETGKRAIISTLHGYFLGVSLEEALKMDFKYKLIYSLVLQSPFEALIQTDKEFASKEDVSEGDIFDFFDLFPDEADSRNLQKIAPVKKDLINPESRSIKKPAKSAKKK
jgi:hypothetical protein